MMGSRRIDTFGSLTFKFVCVLLLASLITCSPLNTESLEVESSNATDDSTSDAELLTNTIDDCSKGYEASEPGVCIDINECETGRHRCDLTHEICYNVIGTYRCIPFELDADNSTKLEENTIFQLSPMSTTTTTEATSIQTEEDSFGLLPPPSSPTLRFPISQCKPGYEIVNGICQDINECTLNTKFGVWNERFSSCPEDYQCVNTPGSYHCDHIFPPCNKGLIWNPGLGQCLDINECSGVPSPCMSFEECINTNGSYICRLKSSSTEFFMWWKKRRP